MIALTVPAGDYEKEAALLTELESMEEIDYSMGLANVEAMNGYMLADKLMPRQFSELADLDYEMAQVLYAAYATEQGDYGKLMGNISSYKVPLIDMFLFVCEQADAGVVQLSSDQTAMLQDAKTQMESAKAQLQGKDYSRMLLYLTLPESGDETYAFLDTVRETAQRYYPDGNVYVAGNSSTEYDFEKSFARDNTVVSIVSLLIVLVACQLDAVIGGSFVRDAAIIGFSANEAISIVENAGLMGLPIPAAITKAIDILKQRAETPEKGKN